MASAIAAATTAPAISTLFKTVPANSTLTWHPCPGYAPFECARLLIPINPGSDPKKKAHLTASHLIRLPALVSHTDPTWGGHVKIPVDGEFYLETKTEYTRLQHLLDKGQDFHDKTGGIYTLIGIHQPCQRFDEEVDPSVHLVNLRKPLPVFGAAEDWPVSNKLVCKEGWFPNLGEFVDYGYEFRYGASSSYSKWSDKYKYDDYETYGNKPYSYSYNQEVLYVTPLPPSYKTVEYDDRDWHCVCPKDEDILADSGKNNTCTQSTWYKYPDSPLYCECTHKSTLDGKPFKVDSCTKHDNFWPDFKTSPILWDGSKPGTWVDPRKKQWVEDKENNKKLKEKWALYPCVEREINGTFGLVRPVLGSVYSWSWPDAKVKWPETFDPTCPDFDGTENWDNEVTGRCDVLDHPETFDLQGWNTGYSKVEWKDEWENFAKRVLNMSKMQWEDEREHNGELWQLFCRSKNKHTLQMKTLPVTWDAELIKAAGGKTPIGSHITPPEDF
ncbi:hypothetical protein BJ508DRAFT_362740 [Ascobolus immersus RN42]|uniref:Uncharacterized protein n=1 Tax=Ascobolus immersus RN42 TaxID=1160509 RepID=A0A3N4I217_ASCIM|nr:hypothetical protein BJ508DRAFT_362740 [Ascobolus immersus RN42]